MRRLLLALSLIACSHAAPVVVAPPPPPPPPPDPRVMAAQLSDELHALFRAEGELLWTRWTTGAGPFPSSALAEHPRLVEKESWQFARDAHDPLLADELATLYAAHLAAPQLDALDHAKAQLAFAAPGDARPERGERDLEKLLSDEPDAKKRAQIANEEARAAAALGPLALARDGALQSALDALPLRWADGVAARTGLSLDELQALAEATLNSTESAAAQAVAASSVRNLGVTIDRLRRADLPRLVREAAADAQFAPGNAWPEVEKIFAACGIAVPPSLRVDAEPSPSKGARPLALLVDPPSDVRLSLRPAGGFDEMRATLHEGARALAGASTQTARWEEAQLGSGAVPEAVAQVFESLVGAPLWLRETTQLRGEPLDDVVHTEATRRLLGARRAAAMTLFEIRRRGLDSAAQSALYRSLLQRATFATLTDDDAQRWALQSDPSLPSANTLIAFVLAAQLEAQLGEQWWKAPQPLFASLWRSGRAPPPAEALKLLALPALDPVGLSQRASLLLSYKAPDAPPPAQKPDYKFMQGDRRRRHVKKKKAKSKPSAKKTN